MTKQTQMLESENFHLIEISSLMFERLACIKILPHYILNIGNSAFFYKQVLQERYPKSIILDELNFKKESPHKIDMIFAVMDWDSELSPQALSCLIAEWKKILASGGLLMMGLINSDLDIREIGDFLIKFGFVDVVIDKEKITNKKQIEDRCYQIIFMHAWKAKPVSVSIDQIRLV